MMTDVSEVAERAKKMMADAVPAIVKDVCEVDAKCEWKAREVGKEVCRAKRA